ncbi:MAG: anion permease [Planctomycetes bacterium]|nr:anion permease [Planctomycetota bacterium]
MELTILLFLSSGLFLGWSLGANDAANVFGTAVGSRMVRFGSAAVICGVFVILGAVIAGAGPAHGLGQLGAVNTLAGAFVVALAAALTVYAMTKLGLPVSTTQAVVGAIVGWNLFSGSPTNLTALARIVGTWISGPILGALAAFLLYRALRGLASHTRIHMLWRDLFARIGLIAAGALGAYSLGANNVANVVGVFVPSSPFVPLDVLGAFQLSPGQLLFLLGGIAIAVGVFYSRRVMLTVGRELLPVSPLAAWVVVVSQSLVLLLFSSTTLRQLIADAGLPPPPLVPVSSSQAVVGAVMGIGLAHGLKGIRQVKWAVLGHIAAGWVATPVLAAIGCFVLLFFLQNVFQQQVHQELRYRLGAEALERLRQQEVPVGELQPIAGHVIPGRTAFLEALRSRRQLPGPEEDKVLAAAELHPMRIAPARLGVLDPALLDADQIAAVRSLEGQAFDHKWQLAEALARAHVSWRPRPEAPHHALFNERLRDRLDYLYWTFRIPVGASPHAP